MMNNSHLFTDASNLSNSSSTSNSLLNQSSPQFGQLGAYEHTSAMQMFPFQTSGNGAQLPTPNPLGYTCDASFPSDGALHAMDYSQMSYAGDRTSRTGSAPNSSWMFPQPTAGCEVGNNLGNSSGTDIGSQFLSSLYSWNLGPLPDLGLRQQSGYHLPQEHISSGSRDMNNNHTAIPQHQGGVADPLNDGMNNVPLEMTTGTRRYDEKKPTARCKASNHLSGAQSDEGIPVKIPKKRGPKKKPFTKEREVKMKVRRMRANYRERNRMHGLNDALEALRSHVPTFSPSQRLSKIETLRLARNYIAALDSLLRANADGQPAKNDPLLMALILTDGLTQNTTNLVLGQLQVNANELLQLRNSISGGDISNLSNSSTPSMPVNTPLNNSNDPSPRHTSNNHLLANLASPGHEPSSASSIPLRASNSREMTSIASSQHSTFTDLYGSQLIDPFENFYNLSNKEASEPTHM